MIIVAATLDFADQATRDLVVDQAIPLQKATRDDEAGCLAYCFGADPVVPTRIQVYELWTDGPALVAHFDHPHYAAMRDMLLGHGIVAAANRAYLTEQDCPVYLPDGVARSNFFED
ncbi:MAG: antibiotic biosynthesis monooxygenase [Ilumatobacteraceae bacterium]